ncbi:class I adenylate-forming enzyme family protein [Gordonia neofelifaecis]|uniref:Fatty acid-CoA ligase FadD13_1 n=1 Tax=Gordonia neofelifaecis NRRL B-59395 TaxID=644548 RepID=F1YIG7_9ACTN|nr:AMP-binding protein [Gordonia neofelifaecis]EGD55721.1 fatty acid-CoA ligase FadD13_1 [Gordonia neofelifaecis NRRL B-59395]
MSGIVPISRARNPFPQDGVTVDARGVPHLDELPSSLIAMLAVHVDARPDAEAVVELGGERLTYRELWDRAARIAGGLRGRGLQRGDRVAVRYPAGVDWVLAFWGVLFAGGIVVAVNTRSSESEVAFLLDDSGASIDLAPGADLPVGDPFVDETATLTDVAALFYTSGTTGRPKGVPTTHEAFLTNTGNVARCFAIPSDIGTDMRTLICVPLFHVTGCNSQLLVAAYYGGTAVIMPTLDVGALIGTLAAERITFLVTVPAIYALMLRHADFAGADTSTVRWLAYGGAPIAPSLVASLKRAFDAARVANGYGMTESASLMTVLPHEDAEDHADSVGYAVPSVELGVAPFGDEPGFGELVVRGANITAGYWQRPDATAETIVDGWLHTGDVVRVDDAGRVRIVDRTKDIINRGGENVSSIEVESALMAVPGVLEAAVIAVPDDVLGEKVGAVIYTGGETIDVAEVIAAVSESIADFKVPQFVSVITEPLPRNPGGKIVKGRVRDSVVWGEALR